MNVTTRNMDLQGGLGNPIKMVVQDHNSRFLKVTLTNEGRALDLTNKQVFISTSGILNGEEYNIENEGIVNDAFSGICTFEITANMLPEVGCHNFQIIIREVIAVDTSSRLTYPKFKITVTEYITNEPLIIAENSSSILDDLNEININLDECMNKVGDKDDEADTLFGKINTLITESGLSYDEFRSRFTDLDTIIGEANPTVANTDTVMNYLKLLDFSTRDGWVKDKKDDLYSPNMECILKPESHILIDFFTTRTAYDDTHFYYVSSNVMYKRNISDHSIVHQVSLDEDVTQIVVTDTHLYLSRPNNVSKMRKSDLFIEYTSEYITNVTKTLAYSDGNLFVKSGTRVFALSDTLKIQTSRDFTSLHSIVAHNGVLITSGDIYIETWDNTLTRISYARENVGNKRTYGNYVYGALRTSNIIVQYDISTLEEQKRIIGRDIIKVTENRIYIIAVDQTLHVLNKDMETIARSSIVYNILNYIINDIVTMLEEARMFAVLGEKYEVEDYSLEVVK